jgi:hypothetical protein
MAGNSLVSREDSRIHGTNVPPSGLPGGNPAGSLIYGQRWTHKGSSYSTRTDHWLVRGQPGHFGRFYGMENRESTKEEEGETGNLYHKE